MPAEQRGSIYRTNTGYGIRYTGEHGSRKRRSGFRSRSAARHWLEQVEKPRQRGEPAAAPRLTFDEFADRYLQAHSSTVEASTIRTLEHQARLRALGVRERAAHRSGADARRDRRLAAQAPAR